MDKQYYIYGLGLCCEQKNWFNACELSWGQMDDETLRSSRIKATPHVVCLDF